MVRGTPWIDLANGGVPKQLRRQIVPGCRPSPQSCRRRLLYLQKSRRIESSRRLNVIPMTSLHLLQRKRADQSTFDRMGRNLAPKPKLAGREPNSRNLPLQITITGSTGSSEMSDLQVRHIAVTEWLTDAPAARVTVKVVA